MFVVTVFIINFICQSCSYIHLCDDLCFYLSVCLSVCLSVWISDKIVDELLLCTLYLVPPWD